MDARAAAPALGPPVHRGPNEGRSAIRRPSPAVAGLAALVLLLALGGASLAGALSTPGQSATPVADPTADPQVVEAGRGLYVANCASCHGDAGQGTANGPSLQNAGAAAADFYLRTGRMPLGAPGQRAIRQPVRFNETDIEALVAYVASLGSGPAIPQVQAGTDVHRGWELYIANCAACHTVTGAGNAIGGGFVAASLGQATPQEIAEAMTIGPGAMPRFGFDQADRDAIVAYLRYIRSAPSPGGAPIAGTGPVAEGFVGLFVVLPILVVLAVFAAWALRGPGRPRATLGSGEPRRASAAGPSPEGDRAPGDKRADGA